MVHIPCEILLYKYRPPTWNKVRFWFPYFDTNFRFIFRKEAAAHFALCWDLLYQILRGKEKCVVITTKASWGLISMCYLHIWPFDGNKILLSCFFFSYYCRGRTNGLTTWWPLGDNHNKHRLDLAWELLKPVFSLLLLPTLLSRDWGVWRRIKVKTCQYLIYLSAWHYHCELSPVLSQWPAVRRVREGMWRGGAATTGVWLIFLLGMFLVWKLWKINILSSNIGGNGKNNYFCNSRRFYLFIWKEYRSSTKISICLFLLCTRLPVVLFPWKI